MRTQNELILVEGTGDQDFIGGLLKEIGKTGVEPFPPRQLGGPSNGINNVIKMIPVLMNLILDGTTTKAAILIDADYTGHNGGFAARRKQVTDLLAIEGYVIPVIPTVNADIGEVFNHPDGRTAIGLFILPNHKDDGMLEDMLAGMVTDEPYRGLLNHAKAVVNSLPITLFNLILHTSKAEVGTFMAWQKKPPAHAGACVRDSIFNANAPASADLLNWIHRVF